ncbi:aprataxin-like [Branchiostoma lanceolatum]|uniref:aprataxin-like n=1 Tax=Branchiostoma lanceolatum TaxID=7740 RepID=UPI0034531E32
MMAAKGNAFSVIMNAQKRKLADGAAKTTSQPAKKGHWSMGLLSSMEDPALKVESDDKVVIIKDKYPKARYHWLVLPKENIPSLKAVSSEQLDLLKHMHKKGQELIDKTEDAKHLSFRLGYHAIPSMSHLHLHVISQDFDSPCLKHKKHWNSFTTDYFMDSEDVVEELEKEGKITDKGSRNDRLKYPLRCHVCKKEQVNMPKLKAHILSHIPKPGDKE